MRNFQDTLETRKRPLISGFLICMVVCTFKNNFFVEHVRTPAFDLSLSVFGKLLSRDIFCKIHIVEMHSFHPNFRVNLIQTYFRILYNTKGVFRTL